MPSQKSPWLWLLPLLTRLALASGSPLSARAPANNTYDWNEIPTSTEKINWAPCFQDFLCTRLEVPLDYEDESVGTTKVAFIKYSSKNESAEDLLFNFGGPGGSGIGTLIPLAPDLAEVYGSGVNLVSFDPRGVNNTGPALDCFPGDPATRHMFGSTYFRAIPDAGSDSAATQFYLAEALGNWCNNAIGGPNGTAQYVNTPAVANDMLRFVEVQSATNGKPKEDAKLWYNGYSYGTALGTTFATLHPDRIGRMILDGVEDPADYYNGLWSNNLLDADAGVDNFVSSCHAAGPDACVMYENSTDLIYSRLSSILTNQKEKPVPVWNSSVVGMPVLATYADLTNVLLLSLYFPLASFPKVAQIMVDLEHGQGESLIVSKRISFRSNCQAEADFDGLQASMMILCTDSDGRGRINSVEEYQEYLSRDQRGASRSGKFSGITGADTSFPILFVGNTLDPVTPLAKESHLTIPDQLFWPLMPPE
uniref:AB hydrolase-1 domain-containing protein n=1 Tax=Bionectria ochroleuca TaxID=29856 RepID=A0A8H7N2X3_BIOOC